MLTPELCDKYRNTGASSCAAWLAGESDQPPDHVCLEVAHKSTIEFAQRRKIPYIDAIQDAYAEYLAAWPVPVGRDSIARWSFNYRAVSAGAGGGVIPSQILSNSLAFSGKVSFPEIDDSEGAFPDVPIALLADDYAWLGFVAQRAASSARWWLLGRVAKVGESTALPTIYTEEGDTIDITLSWGDEEQEGRDVKTQWDEGVGFSVWRYMNPAVLIEAYPAKPGEIAALTKEADKLLKWYNVTLLGKEFKTRGGGRSRDFSTPADFIAELIRVLEDWRFNGSGDITKEKVAKRMRSRFSLEVSKRSVTNYLQRLDLTWGKARDLDFLRSYTPPVDWPE